MIVRGSRGALAAVGLLLAGCGAEPRQWLVSVATDAPVPHFGDHLLLEVVGADASCTGCLRIISVDGPDSLPVSFGVVPFKEGDTVRIRARLYRAEQVGTNGLPDSPALIDAVAKLPPIEGETRVALNLSMRCFGVASVPEEGKTCDPAMGTLAPEPVLPLLSSAKPQPKAGSWPNAAPVPCRGQVPDGMVCVPGGAFILGTPRPEYVTDSDASTQPEHIVQLSPFAMDIDEVTVGTVRGLVASGKLPSAPVVKDRTTTKSLTSVCTYLGASDGADDKLPVNCISHVLAEAACAALGKRLPTEAEWEYAAGNLAEETPYPWGDGGDLCAMAVIGVGRNVNEVDMNVFEGFGCRPLGGPSTWGPVAGGNPNDVTALGIRNLAGSMAEWMADAFAPYTAPCWQPNGPLLVDPLCRTQLPGAPTSFTVRGSAWNGYKLDVRVSARGNPKDAKPSSRTGFRCALSM